MSKGRKPAEEADENSRSQRKRDVEALQELGEAILKLTPSQRQRIPMPDALRQAVEEALAITAHGALRRQRQYIGKLMRNVDPEPIRKALEAILKQGHVDAARFHQLERWRDRLIAEGDGAVGEALVAFPQAESQHLRTLVRNAQRDASGPEPAKSARALFRYLRQITETSSPPDDETSEVAD